MGVTNDQLVEFSFGVVLCALSATSSVVGMNYQKLFHINNEKKPVCDREAYVKSVRWWLGMCGVVLGALLDFASLAFAPQTIVAAFGASTLVINAWTAPIILKETMTPIEIGATVLITCGATIVVTNASHSSDSESLDSLINRFKTPQFFAYISLVAVVCAGLVVTFRICEARSGRKHGEKDQNKEGLQRNVNGGAASASASSVVQKKAKYSRRLHAVSVTALSGILGAQSLLFAKAFMLILKQAIAGHGKSPFARWETYIIILCTVSCVLSQTHTLNTALARFAAVFVLPIFQVFWIIGGVVGAGVFYNEFAAMWAAQLTMLMLGFLIIAYGIYMLGFLHTKHLKKDPVDLEPKPTFRSSIVGVTHCFVLDTDWQEAYETNFASNRGRAFSADLGFIQRQLYGSGNNDWGTAQRSHATPPSSNASRSGPHASTANFGSLPNTPIFFDTNTPASSSQVHTPQQHEPSSIVSSLLPPFPSSPALRGLFSKPSSKRSRARHSASVDGSGDTFRQYREPSDSPASQAAGEFALPTTSSNTAKQRSESNSSDKSSSALSSSITAPLMANQMPVSSDDESTPVRTDLNVPIFVAEPSDAPSRSPQTPVE